MIEASNRISGLAKSEDVAAASELVGLFYERIYAYFRRLCGNHESAKDLTQETLCKAWFSVQSYRNRSSFSTWLHGIAYHVYVDWTRKADRVDYRSDAWWEACVADSASPFKNAEESELASRAYVMVQGLEEASRQVVHLHYYQGLSLKETAQALGIAVSTVKYRLRGALSFLRSNAVKPRRRMTAARPSA